MYAQPVIHAEQQQFINQGKKLSYFKDSTAQISFSQIQNLSFRSGDQDVLNFGINKGAYWFKFNYVAGPSARVVFDRPNVDSVQFYIPDSAGHYNVYSVGNYSTKNTLYPSTNFVFELPATSTPRTVWVRMRTTNIVLMPMKVASAQVVESSMIKRTMLEAAYAGMLFLLFVISFLLFFRIKERVYFYYAGYVFCLIVYILLYHRGYSHLLHADFGGMFGRYAYIFALCGYICAALFADRFLELRRHSAALHKLLKAVTLVIGVSIPVSFFLSPYFGASAVQFFGLIQTIVLLTSGIIIYIKGVKIARYYVLAWGSIMTALMYMLISFQGWIPFKDFTYQALALGSTLELSLLAAALADRIRLQSVQKEKAVRDYNLLQEKSRAELENTVAARTTDLQLTLETLQKEKQQKDDLFRIVIHDVRSPVANLYQMMQMVESGHMSQHQMNNFFPALKADTGRVLDTMGKLLQWSTLGRDDAGKPEEFLLFPMLVEHVSMYKQLTEDKMINLQLACNDDVTVFADRDQLSLILRNLIDNAIKFTPHSGIIVVSHADRNNADRISIFNTSSPLSEEKIGNLQNDSGIKLSEGTKAETGVGLGLQLCREFLRKMGSKMQVRNVDGGVEFFFDLP